MTGSRSGSAPLLTLEPLLEAVREGIESAGWPLSGLQKTTSHEFEGRWAGEDTRSAYLFFHRPAVEAASVEAFLDETSRGLKGNVTLVLDGPELGDLPPAADALDRITELVRSHLPAGYPVSCVLRLRVPRLDVAGSSAGTEVRVKLGIPRAALEAGASAVSALASATVAAFEDLLADPACSEVLSL